MITSVSKSQTLYGTRCYSGSMKRFTTLSQTFFTMMGNMGADVFDLEWVQATINLFTLFWLGIVRRRNGRRRI